VNIFLKPETGMDAIVDGEENASGTDAGFVLYLGGIL
jgi:hypothetical protein